MPSERILVIQTAFIGDTILTLPLIQKISKTNPEALIDVLCIPSTKIIFDASPVVNRVIVLDKRGIHKSLFRFSTFIIKLKKNNYQKVISPHRSFRSAILTFLINAKDSTGFSNSSFTSVFKKIISYNKNVHEVERNLSLIDNSKVDLQQCLPMVFIRDEHKLRVNDIINSSNSDNLICIAPGSVWNTKKYPAEYFSEIAVELEKRNYKVILIGSASENDLCEQIAGRLDSPLIITNFNLIEIIYLLSKSKLLICNDSSPTHLGMCADIPVITLYCSTIPEFGFYPYNQKSIYLSYNELDCKPCGIHGRMECPIGTFDCGYKLTPELVIRHIKDMI